ncbi:MAG: transglycosylase SLT domain-containing protein [Cyanobacteria bacterium P01_D01_bin.105]
MNRFRALRDKCFKSKWPTEQWLTGKLPLIAMASITTVSVGLIFALLKTTDVFNSSRSAIVNPNIIAEQSRQAVNNSVVLSLAVQTPEARRESLTKIATQRNPVERDRARYLLAADLIATGRGGSALDPLENLETTYRPLAPYVLLKRAQAQAAADQPKAAIATWKQLVSEYPDSAAAAEAIYQLTQKENADAPLYQAQLLTTLPSHPRSVELALSLLNKTSPPGQSNRQTQVIPVKAISQTPPTSAQTPEPNASPDKERGGVLDELSLLKLVAYHGFNHPDYTQALNRLTRDYSSVLTPEDWETIGFGYWETQNYPEAGDAYAQAPVSPLNLYRAARGKDRGGKDVESIALYQKLNTTFPEAPETATGLLNLAKMVPNPIALITLDQVIQRFPNRAAEALVARADILESMKSPESAKQARASILSQYSGSQAAAKIRLKQAKANAKKGDFSAAISWAQQLVEAAPNDELAPEAGFWLGKWLTRSNQPERARTVFESVIRNHSQSYYAWRSAVYLDWNVGDFDTVRAFNPEVALPLRRSPLPAGSATLQELYLLGQDKAAWAQWQTEFTNPALADAKNPTVAEQFTDGILRLGVGDNLNGIFMVSSLAWRDDPSEKAEYEQLRATDEYWQAIYPFPYSDIIKGWAQERQINPLLVTGLVRQESRFQPKIESVVGALGLMQVMPETAEWIGERTGVENYELTMPEDNVEFGTWFLDFTHSQYSNNSLFAVASYNAGPAAVDEWIDNGDFSNADEFVEKIPYPETRGYVDAVFGGYWNYLRLYNPEIRQKVEEL